MFSLEELIMVESFETLSYRDVEKDDDLSLEAMEDEEVALVDGVFEGAFGPLGNERCLLDGLEVEALVDAIEVVEVDDN
uniref:Uncharacterized protein n=1 Tax=Tanacetum cinerariifolium TaxID=118510 RepID=A0A6L2LV47_TANCI|nr:hypothetical protein [Tanacetum cinerariifolium]GEX62350.1 hypothetical protein [Tanacetum cinerariifolium]GEX62571.1 hypothetical protein [Tanacetum cinerariifolium]